MNQTLENTLENATPLHYGLSAVNGRAYRVDTGVNGSERSTFLPVLTPDKTLAHLDLNPDAWMAFLQGCSFWWSAGRRAGLLERNLTMFFLDHFGIRREELADAAGVGGNHIKKILRDLRRQKQVEIAARFEKLSRLRKKGVSVKLPCKLSPEHDDIRPKRVLKSRPLRYSW